MRHAGMKAARGRREERTPATSNSYISINAEGLQVLCMKHHGVDVTGKIWACGCGCAARGPGNQQLLAFGLKEDGTALVVSSCHPGTSDAFTFNVYEARSGAEVLENIVDMAADGVFASARVREAILFAKQVLGMEFWGEWP